MSNELEGLPTSYSILYIDSITGRTCSAVTIPISSNYCIGLSCQYAFEVSSSYCTSVTNFTISAFATNVFGDGPHQISNGQIIRNNIMEKPQSNNSSK